MAKYKKMTDAEIIAAVEQEIKGGVTGDSTELSKERQLVLDYYHGKLPKPQHAGNSKYISMDVFDTVESAKATIVETFAAGYNIAQFEPENEDDVEDARTATEYTEYVIHRQNPGFEIFSTVAHDGLMARIGLVKVYWDKCTYEFEEDFENISVDELDKLLLDEDVTLKEEPEFHPVPETAGGTFSGTIVRTVDTSQVRIDPIPPEEFICSQTAKSIKGAKTKGHRMKKTASDLLKMGLTEEEIDEIPGENDIRHDQETQARFGDLSNGFLEGDDAVQQQMRIIIVKEMYAELDIEGTGKAKCWQIIYAGNKIISKEQVQDDPFCWYCPLPVPHAAFGVNFAKLVTPIQNARSVLIRGILDHTVITNNPRTLVVKGSLTNPREMLDNRLGGIVNVTRPDGVMPYPQAGLNPYVFQTIGLLDEDKEDNTGISKLSQGLNKDAVSQQNSEGLIENLVSLSQQRQKIQARNFANQFLIPLYLKVYQCVLENEKRKKIFEVAGQFKEIKPQDWRERTKVTTVLKLGYGEQEKEVQKNLAIYAFLSQDPELKHLFTVDEKYNTIKKMLANKGEKNVDEYLKNPNKPDPKTGKVPEQQPNPMMQLEIQAKQIEIAAAQAEIQLEKQKQAHQEAMDKLNAQLEKATSMIELMVQQREMERKEFESKSRDEIGRRELDILETTKPTETKQTQIVSPNS